MGPYNLAQKEIFLMFNKKILIPLLIVVVLLGILLAVTMLGGEEQKGNDISSDSSDNYDVNYIFDVDSDSIDLISVKLSGYAIISNVRR